MLMESMLMAVGMYTMALPGKTIMQTLNRNGHLLILSNITKSENPNN